MISIKVKQRPDPIGISYLSRFKEAFQMDVFKVVSGPYDFNKVREECVGKESVTVQARYPVEYEPIRRYCQMVDCANPLFLDPEYGKKSKYGEVICPPAMACILSVAGAMPNSWPPADPPQQPLGILKEIPVMGSAVINMSQDLEFFKPVRVGDRLSSKDKVVDIYKKSIRLDPEAIWVVTETTIKNQDEEVVCTVRNLVLSHRTLEEIQG